MELKEYKNKMAELKRNFQQNQNISAKAFRGKKAVISIEFAKTNNFVGIGDIVGDGFGKKLRVERIGFYYGALSDFILPECSYHGAQVKKNLETFKSGKKAVLFQGSVKEIEKQSN